MTTEGETVPIDVPIHPQPRTLRIFANLTSTQPVSKLQFSLLRKLRRSDFSTSDQVGQKLSFGLPTNLVGSLFFIPDKLSGS